MRVLILSSQMISIR